MLQRPARGAPAPGRPTGDRHRRPRGRGDPTGRLRHRGDRGPPVRTGRARLGVHRRDGLRVRTARRGTAPVQRARLRVGARLGAGDPASGSRVRAGGRRARRGARRRALDPAGEQPDDARRVRGGQARRLRDPHPGRQLVVLPAPQARRGERPRVRQRGDLLLPRGGPRRAHPRPGGVRPAPDLHRRRLDRRDGDRPRRRRLPRPARLPRTVRGHPRPPPVLPQRHGRPRRRAAHARLRRPRPPLGPRQLGRPGARPQVPAHPLPVPSGGIR